MPYSVRRSSRICAIGLSTMTGCGSDDHAPVDERRYRIRASGIAPAASSASTMPVSIALFGMPSKRAVLGSWTRTRPPASCTSLMPREPSLPVPDRMTAIALRPASCASERRK